MNVLKNKGYLNYDRLSRYSEFPYWYNVLDEKYICGVTAYLNDSTACVNYVIQSGDTYDNIALRAYGNPTYYWIICSYNRIQDPFEDPVVGTTIKLPVMSDIQYG